MKTETTTESPETATSPEKGDWRSTSCSLFRVIVLHGAPKDSHTSTECYLIAASEEAVAAWIDKEKCYGNWFDDDAEDEPSMRYADDDYETEIPFKDWVLKNRGDLSDDEGWEDAYYGVTKWGWEPVEATTDDIETMLRLGIAILPANSKH